MYYLFLPAVCSDVVSPQGIREIILLDGGEGKGILWTDLKMRGAAGGRRGVVKNQSKA